MAETTLMAVATSILEKLCSFTGELVSTHVTEEIKAAMAVKKDLKQIADKLHAICAVLRDAEEKQYANDAIKVWLRDLSSVVYDIDDLLDEVATDSLQQNMNKVNVLRQLRYYLSLSNPCISRFVLSHKIRELREKLDEIVAKKNDFGLTEHPFETPAIDRNPLDACAYVNKPDIVGREAAKQDVINRLAAADGRNGLNVLPIIGIGGVGKTAFAKLVYHDNWIAHTFDLKLWACVSDKFDLQKTIGDIISSALDEDISYQNLRWLLEKLRDLLKEKKFFLVLDDVWVQDINVWTEFKNLLSVGEEGSSILVTTRLAKVASITGTNEPFILDSLPNDVCLYMFKQIAFKKGEEQRYPNLAALGESIVDKCAGLPLAVKALGSSLRSERDERIWRKFSTMDSFIELHTHYDNVMRVLKLSYDKLPSDLKPYFAYCSLFAKGSTLNRQALSYYWRALGLSQPEKGENETEDKEYACLTKLISRSLLQNPLILFDETILFCNMHDLLHDVAVHVMGDELAIVTCNKLKVSELSRHIVWGFEGRNALSHKEFPKELVKAKKARTFTFGYPMDHISKSFLEGIISNFRCLRILNLSFSKFDELPMSIGNLKHLRYLDFKNNSVIKVLPNTICKLLNLQTLHLYGCKNLEELPRDVDKLSSLTHFTVTTSQVNLAGTKFNGLNSLQGLVYYSCTRLESLWDSNVIGNLTSLRALDITYCPRLICLPNSIKYLASLEALCIGNCHELDLDTGCLQGLQNLKKLVVIKIPKLVRLPDATQFAANTLQYLSIRSCENLIELAEWSRPFTSLLRVKIHDCPNLLALPEGIQHLTSLQTLDIKSCPHITRRYGTCLGDDDTPSPNISHIQEIIFDGSRITKSQTL